MTPTTIEEHLNNLVIILSDIRLKIGQAVEEETEQALIEIGMIRGKLKIAAKS